MQEKELIKRIGQLSGIKPRREWVVLTKNNIFGDIQLGTAMQKRWKTRLAGLLEFLPALTYQRKLAYAFATFLFIMVGMFGFAQYTMPGDMLFSIKKMAEQGQIVFISPSGQLQYMLDIASKRLSDLTQVVKNNRAENIAPAIKEFQASISQAAKNLALNISKRDSTEIKDIALQIKKIEENKKELQTLGVNLEDTEESKELNNAIAPLVNREIEDLKKTTLTEEQQKSLEEIKALYKEGNYFQALERILIINK